MSLAEQIHPGSLYAGPSCRARNENIEGASCEFVAFGSGAHLCVRPQGHTDKMPPEIAKVFPLGDDHICECGVRWK